MHYIHTHSHNHTILSNHSRDKHLKQTEPIMATIASSSSEATKKLEDQLTCPVCLDQFTDPRTLPCLHSFCIQCLKGVPLDLKGNSKRTLSCPTCRTEADLPQQGVDAFHKAFHLNNLIEVHELMKKVNVSGGKSTVCDHCKKVEAIGYCPECTMFLCHSCNNVHKSWHQTSSHKLIGIDEVSSKTAEMVSVKPEPVINCSSHNRPLDIYCVNCDQPICYLCTIKDHKGHSQDLIPDAYQDGKAVMQIMLENLTQKIERISRIKENLKGNQQAIEANSNKVKNLLDRLFDAIFSELQKAKNTAQQSVTSGIQSKLKLEEQQLKTVEVFLESLHHCREHTERSLQMDTPLQLLMTKNQLTARINTLVESDECDSIEPIEVTGESDEIQNITDESIEEVTSEFSDLSKAFILPLQFSTQFYQRCELMPHFPRYVTQSVESTASFIISFQGEPVLVDKDIIQCSFRNENDEIDCELNYLIKDEKIQYQLRFTADKPGNYTFSLEIDENEIKSEQAYLGVMPA